MMQIADMSGWEMDQNALHHYPVLLLCIKFQEQAEGIGDVHL